MQELQTETRHGALKGATAAAVRDYKAELTAMDNKEKGDQRAANQQEIDLLETMRSTSSTSSAWRR